MGDRDRKPTTRRLVVDVTDEAPRAEQVRVARPQLTWRAATIPVTTAGVTIGRDRHGSITAHADECV